VFDFVVVDYVVVVEVVEAVVVVGAF